MPKHAFKFPREVVESVRRHVEQAVQSVHPGRFRQEPQYVTSLITRLEGIAYQGEYGRVELTSTDCPDRGPNSVEKKLGADFAITATVSDLNITIDKAILVQAKLGEVERLSPSALEELKDQIRRMRRFLPAPKVMEITEHELFRDPRIISGKRILQGEPFRSYRLSDYFVARIVTTLDGATNPHVVANIREGLWHKLNVLARIES